MTFDLTAVIRPEVQAIVPYHTGPETAPDRRVKLDANESPFALGEALRGALATELAAALANVELHRYPDPTARELRNLLARDLGVTPEQLLVSNGSDEAIQMLQMTVASPGAAVAIPVPTFVMYALGARVLGMRVAEVPLGKDFGLDAGRFVDVVRTAQPRLVFLAWPNNPTGQLFAAEAVEAILRACDGRDCRALVVVDEAYAHYSGRSFLPRLSEFPNLVILRTLSKIGLAGIRLGMLIASPAVVREVNKVRMPYNVNALTQAAAKVILAHGDVVRRQAAAIVVERERVFAALDAMPGITAFQSDANFILIRTGRPGALVFTDLLQRGILVRDFSRAPYLADCLRVTVGTPEENDAFLTALAAHVNAGRVS
jgi:histidinol-phosphate aminotransferase